MNRIVLAAAFVVLLAGRARPAEDPPVFSGPQPGEVLAPFDARGAYDQAKGEDLDVVTAAAGDPLLLVFVHDANRPSIALTRALMEYAAERRRDGLRAGVIFLTDDPTETAAFLGRARHAMPDRVPIGISADGREGPGAYGLNRNVTLTVLVARNDRVTANFALVQPSVRADAPKVLKAVVDLIGGEVPSPERLVAGYGRAAADTPDASLRELISPVIRKGASPEEVDRAAAEVAVRAAGDPKLRDRIGTVARRIIEAGKLDDYGTPRAREHLRRWAAEFKAPGPGDEPAPRPTGPDDGDR